MSPPAGGHKGRPYIFGVPFLMGCLVALICRGGACPRPRAAIKAAPTFSGFRFWWGVLWRLYVGAGAHTRPQAIRQDRALAFGCVPDAGDLSVPGGDETNMANYTEYYHLHQWEPEDSFLRTDFNEDFRRIAAALQEKLGQADRAELAAAAAEKAKLSCGAFLGNGTSQSIPLGFRPSAVLLPGRSGLLLASRQTAAGAIEIIQQGFRVVHEDGAIDRINESGKTYPYLAFLEGQIP